MSSYLPILSSFTSDPRPVLHCDGTRSRRIDWSRPDRGVLQYRGRGTVPHVHPASRVLGILRETWDDGDPFGSAMTALGAVCDVLAGCGVWGVIPQGWGYWPGGGGMPRLEYDEQTGEGYHTSAVCEVLGIDPADPAEPSADDIRELLHAGAVFDRIVEQCRLAGVDY